MNLHVIFKNQKIKKNLSENNYVNTSNFRHFLVNAIVLSIGKMNYLRTLQILSINFDYFLSIQISINKESCKLKCL